MDVYRPDHIIIDLGGFEISAAAYAKGTFVKVSQNEDDVKLNVGSGGEATAVVSMDESATITITIMRQSSANDALSAKRAKFKAGGGADPLLIKDLKGTTLYHAENAWVQKISDSEFSNEDTAREWLLQTDKMESFVGGRT